MHKTTSSIIMFLILIMFMTLLLAMQEYQYYDQPVGYTVTVINGKESRTNHVREEAQP